MFGVAVSVCAAALVCSLVSALVPDGSNKKLIGFVMGAFMVCSMISPVKSAISELSGALSSEDYADGESFSASADETYAELVLAQTKENLERTLNDLLLQNGVEINSCEIILAETDSQSIIISSISIYMSEAYIEVSSAASETVKENFGITPYIYLE